MLVNHILLQFETAYNHLLVIFESKTKQHTKEIAGITH